MAKTRPFYTKFWHDPYIQTLSVSEKLLYIYLFTNIHVNLAGIYEAGTQTIINESGLTKNEILSAMDRFMKDGKLHYEENYVILLNFKKYQPYNESMIKNAEQTLKELPEKIQDVLIKIKHPTDTP